MDLQNAGFDMELQWTHNGPRGNAPPSTGIQPEVGVAPSASHDAREGSLDCGGDQGRAHPQRLASLRREQSGEETRGLSFLWRRHVNNPVELPVKSHNKSISSSTAFFPRCRVVIMCEEAERQMNSAHAIPHKRHRTEGAFSASAAGGRA